MKMIRNVTLPLIALLALTACETIEGAGRDLEGAGATISQEARKTQSDM